MKYIYIIGKIYNMFTVCSEIIVNVNSKVHTKYFGIVYMRLNDYIRFRLWCEFQSIINFFILCGAFKL